MVVEASPNSPPGDVALLTTSLPLAAPYAKKVTPAAVEEAASGVLLLRPFGKGKAK